MAVSNVSWKKRVAIIAIGLLTNEIFDLFFDNILYPRVIGFYGMLLGGAIMISLSIIICYGLIKFYDWSKRDWLGLESLKESKEFENSWINRMIAKFMKKSHWAQLIALSISKDPFITTVFLRKGAHEYVGMTGKDWKNFWLSIFISNTFWIITCWSGIAILEALGAKLEVAIAICSGTFIAIALIGFAVGHLSLRKESKTVQVE